MAIIINIDVMMAKRKMSLGELSERVEITPANLSILKNGKAKAIRILDASKPSAANSTASRATSSSTVRTPRPNDPKRPNETNQQKLHSNEKITDSGRRPLPHRRSPGADQPHGADAGRPGRAPRQARQRHELLHPPQRETQGTGRFLHRTLRGRHSGERRPAGLAHFLEHMAFNGTKKPARQGDDRLLRAHRREVRQQPQRLHHAGQHPVLDHRRAHHAPGHHRHGTARAARLVALHRTRTGRDRFGARRNHGRSSAPATARASARSRP